MWEPCNHCDQHRCIELMAHYVVEFCWTPYCITKTLQEDSALSPIIPWKNVCFWVSPFLVLLLLQLIFPSWFGHRRIMRGCYGEMDNNSPGEYVKIWNQWENTLEKNKSSYASFTLNMTLWLHQLLKYRLLNLNPLKNIKVSCWLYFEKYWSSEISSRW